MPADNPVSEIKVAVEGAPWDTKDLVEARIEDSLTLPDVCLLKVGGWDMKEAKFATAAPFDFGKKLEVKLAYNGSLVTVFKGAISSLAPEFGPDGVYLTVCAFDESHKLNRERKTQTFNDMTYSDIASQVAGSYGLAATTDSAPGGKQDFVQQSAETDWEFLWRLAERIDFEVAVSDGKFYFRKAGSAKKYQPTVTFGETLISFRARVTGIQQTQEVEVRGWDPKTKQAFVANSSSAETDTTIGISRSAVVSNMNGGKVLVANAPVQSQSEAAALASSVLSKIAQDFVEADGSCLGDPNLGAGSLVEIKGVDPKFAGKYSVTQTTHLFKGSHGYHTDFRVTGRTQRSLVDLIAPSNGNGGGSSWGGGVVVGVVTNNDDSSARDGNSGVGRVRVKFPDLGDNAEGWWARIAAPSAGKDRGLLMMPVVGEEVLVAFEHGDFRRPYVLGSLFNGKEKPGDLFQKDGSFALASDKFVNVTAKENISIKTDKDFILETTGKTTKTAQQDLSIEGKTTIKVKAGTTLSIEGTSQLDVKCGQAQISMTPGSLDVKCGPAKVSLTAGGTVSVSGTTVSIG